MGRCFWVVYSSWIIIYTMTSFCLVYLRIWDFLGLIFVPRLDFAPHLVWNNFVDTDVCLQSLQCKPPKNDVFSSTILWLIQLKLRYAVSCCRCSWVLIAIFVEESSGLSLQTVWVVCMTTWTTVCTACNCFLDSFCDTLIIVKSYDISI